MLRGLPFRLWRRLSLGVALALLLPSLAASQAVAPDPALGESVVFIRNNRLFPVELETTLFRPEGPGPFPVVVIHHGKDTGNNRLQPRARFLPATQEFLQRGYAVVLPMRQGFSNSGGAAVGEGCNIAGNGEAQADDVRAVVAWIAQQPWADTQRIVMMGQSHGGLTTMAYAQDPHPGIRLFVNFAGGLRWTSGSCPWEQELIQAFGRYGSKVRVPSIWFYGANDSFFPPKVIQPAYDAFARAGGTAELVAFGPFGNDAHGMFSSFGGLPIWWKKVEERLAAAGLPTRVIYRQYARGRTTGPAQAAASSPAAAASAPIVTSSTSTTPTAPASPAAAAPATLPASADRQAAAALLRQPQRVQVASQEAGIALPGYWFPASAPGGAAVVALHGCGGLGARGGRLGVGQLRYAQMLNDVGVGVLFTESFEPRGEGSLCSQKPAERSITEVNRRLDVYGALAWLAAQPGIDGQRLGVIGWSHGGQTVLFSADRSSDVVAKAAIQPAMLVAFYPGCTALERSAAFQPVAPLLVMSGALDNWTAAAPCRRLVQRLSGRSGQPIAEYIEFPDSYHGFDGTQAVRERSDIGGTASGRAMVGGNPAARDASAQALMRFVGSHLKP